MKFQDDISNMNTHKHTRTSRNQYVPHFFKVGGIIRVGRSIFILIFFLFFIFPDFTKKHNKCIVCTKYITKRGLFGLFAYNTEWVSYCKGI